MTKSTDPAFCNEEAAYRFLEARIWPDGPVCPHCGRGDRIGRLAGQDPKPGSYKCYACRKPFNVKLGTMLESTHVPLHLWLQALYLLHACRPPMSVNRLHRLLGVSSRTTWLMSQRFRERLAQTDPERARGGTPVVCEEADVGPVADRAARRAGTWGAGHGASVVGG